MNRTCLYVDETMATEGGFIPSVVTENEPGHAPLSGNGPFASPWVFGPTIEQAKAQVADHNAQMGVTEDAALVIVLSSMAASFSEGASS